MAFRKEEERKQLHNKTGGGVFNLIFRRGKSSMGSGSISSDTRSISPTHSDCSRSVTPPGVAQKSIFPPPKEEAPTERPKPPLRKRRLAPKPPQQISLIEDNRRNSSNVEIETESNLPSIEDIQRVSKVKPQNNASEEGVIEAIKSEGALVISHSRTSSDSSGYHEASVLSENCNMSLPRRPKSAFVGSRDREKLSNMHSQSSSNLSQMASHSKSTVSLGITGRKKKAPPPPPPFRAISQKNIESASPVVASQSANKTESITSFQALDHLDSANHRSDNKEIPQPFGSTDSGIAQETNEKLSETEDCRLFPPPPPLPLDDPPLDQQLKNEVLVLERPEKREEEIQIKSTPVSEEVKSKPSRQVVENTAPKELYNDTNEIFITSPDLCDINWQYQLPSPPKAFRDYSESVDSESQSVTNFKESDSLKKRKSIEDIRSLDTFDAQSGTFIADEPPLNNLSLENLEKRKSLVYNRELSTSLKISDEIRMDPSMKFESTIVEVQKPSYKGISTPKNNQPHTTNTLPNFKISTYDRPKEKIKVFEDDTIRSSENGFKNVKKTYVEGYTSNRVYSHLNRFSLASSMDNVSLRRNSIDDKTGEKQYSFYRHDHFPDTKKDETAFKSECSNNENTLSPGKSVSRSRSHLTLDGNNKHKKEKQNNGKKGIERSNSLYDMSGLQSLGVMRLIQSKLNIPTSLENLIYVQEKTKNPKDILTQQTENPHRVNAQKTTAIENVYKYQGPPSINMSTWSERLKVPVSVKEDEDYTLGNSISYKLIVNTTNNSITSNNSIEIKNSSGDELNISENKGENVKIDGTALHPKIIDNQRFISHTTPTGYRKPFTDIDKYKRPHSETNVSRVPVVRSVELKKPYKDFENISVTQINTQQNSVVDEKKSFSNFGHFKPSIAPTVRGFKPLPKDKEAFATNTHVPFSQITLRRTSSRNLYDEIKETKAKQPENEVEHSKNNIEHPKNEVIPPIPPVIPKENFRKPVRRQIEPIVDTRDQLLEAIRSFGGKKGLKPANM